MKIDRKKLKDAIEYIELINSIVFDDLDFSEYPEINNYGDEEIVDFKFLGLNNVHLIDMIGRDVHFKDTKEREIQ